MEQQSKQVKPLRKYPDLFDGDVFLCAQAEEIFDRINEKARIRVLMDVVKRKSQTAYPFVIERLKVEENEFVIASLVRAAGILGDSTTISVLQPFLKHFDARVRANAVEGLASIGDDLLLGLTSSLLWDKAKRVREAAFKVHMSCDRDAAKEAVAKLLTSPDLQRQEYGIEYLPYGGAEWVDSLGIEYLEAQPEDRLFALAVEAVSAACSQAVIARLIKLRNTSSAQKAAALRLAIPEAGSRLGVSEGAMDAFEEAAVSDVKTDKIRFSRVDHSSKRSVGKYFVLAILGTIGIGVYLYLGQESVTGIASTGSDVKQENRQTSSLTTSRKKIPATSTSEKKSVKRAYVRRTTSGSRSYSYERDPFETNKSRKARRLAGKRKPRSW